MKFSYKILKKLAPGIKSRADLIEKLSAHVFESEAGEGDNLIEIKVPSNRYSSAAGYWGLAREIAAAYGGKSFREPAVRKVPARRKESCGVEISDGRCRRMMTRPFFDVKVQSSPKWLRDALESLGQRAVNNLVDIANYVTAETGQPLHIFDLDKMTKVEVRGDARVLKVRRAKKGEELTLLGGQRLVLDAETMVLADANDALDIAGIKGGAKAEVDQNTRNALLTAGNFQGAAIYKAMRRTNVMTDASNRFAHDLSPALVSVGFGRASELIAELGGKEVRAGETIDRYAKPAQPVSVMFHIKALNKLTGLALKKSEAFDILRRLGFKIKGNLVAVPILRDDISVFEDLAEEVARFYGFNKAPSRAPRIDLCPQKHDDSIVFQSRVKRFFIETGYDEVYNYSFISESAARKRNTWGYTAPALKNPMAKHQTHLRSALLPHLMNNVRDNLRHFAQVRVFEVGRVFHELHENGGVLEKRHVGFALGRRSGRGVSSEEAFFEGKGLIGELARSFRIADFEFEPHDALGHNGLALRSRGNILGYVERDENGISAGEADLDLLMELAQGAVMYKELPRYPVAERDISAFVYGGVRIGDIVEEIELFDALIQSVDLIDEYDGGEVGGRQSITLRVVLRAEDRTLTGEEVEKIMGGVADRLRKRFGAETR